jgi:hypothetical protein
MLPFAIQASGNLSFYDGWPQTPTSGFLDDQTTQVTQVINFHRADDRFSSVTQIDMSFKKSISNGRFSQPRLDVFNLLNAAAVTNMIQQLGPTTATSSTCWVPADQARLTRTENVSRQERPEATNAPSIRGFLFWSALGLHTLEQRVEPHSRQFDGRKHQWW